MAYADQVLNLIAADKNYHLVSDMDKGKYMMGVMIKEFVTFKDPDIHAETAIEWMMVDKGLIRREDMVYSYRYYTTLRDLIMAVQDHDDFPVLEGIDTWALAREVYVENVCQDDLGFLVDLTIDRAFKKLAA
jgi:hypothetical protein